MAFRTVRFILTTRLAVCLSIFSTLIIVFAPSSSWAEGLRCEALFIWKSEPLPGLDPASAQELASALGNGGFKLDTWHGRLVATGSPRTALEPGRAWWQIKSTWLQRPRSVSLEPLVRDRQRLLVGLARMLNEKKFSARFELGETPRLVVTDKADPLYRREFDLTRILNDRAASVDDFAPIETLDISRELHQQASKFGSDVRVTESGFSMRQGLRQFKNRSEADLEIAMKKELKVLSKNRIDLKPGVAAAIIAAEMLVRRGFEVEVLPSARGVVLARVVGLANGSKNEFTETLERVYAQSGGWFVMDPAFYSSARRSQGVSDTLNFDYSFNVMRLWSQPGDLKVASMTLLHEIHHLENSRRWLEHPQDESIQAMNGWLSAMGKELLGTIAYKTYFQFDEISAAWGDTLNSRTKEDYEKYHARTLDLIQAVWNRIDTLRSRAASGKYRSTVSQSGRYLIVQIDRPRGLTQVQTDMSRLSKMASMKNKKRDRSGSSLFYVFGDLDAKTSREVVSARVVGRLNALEKQLRSIEAAALAAPTFETRDP